MVLPAFYKDHFSNPNSATFWASAKTPQEIPKSGGLPEVIVTGRANAGKSSLFNAVVGRKNLLLTSKKAGRTQALNFYRVGDPEQLVLVDAPGYGARGRVEWGKLFDEYIENREQLKRIYILFSAKNGLNAFDHQMLSLLSQKLVTERGTQPYTLQAIITKADLVPTNNLSTSIALMQKAIWESAPLCLPAIVTSTALNPPFQIDRVRKNIAEACGL
ncbi:P-loop containing nucleoside triphosphate hydrolase protein [Phlegmacium glaucopus]|nr:P-loop containing nucleoside triphosphate hydrolase protein [Phlegmacium glaucopus]